MAINAALYFGETFHQTPLPENHARQATDQARTAPQREQTKEISFHNCQQVHPSTFLSEQYLGHVGTGFRSIYCVILVIAV